MRARLSFKLRHILSNFYIYFKVKNALKSESHFWYHEAHWVWKALEKCQVMKGPLATLKYRQNQPGVDFTSSFYFAHATRKSCQNNVRTKNLYVKRWWNWHQTFIVSNYSKSRISHYKVCLMKNDFFWKIKWTFPWS